MNILNSLILITNWNNVPAAVPFLEREYDTYWDDIENKTFLPCWDFKSDSSVVDPVASLCTDCTIFT
jgi:hypothetical protein